MIEIIIMIGVIGWFARTAKSKGANGLLWGFIGAISFYGPVLVFGRVIYPVIVKGSVTYDNQVSYMIVGVLLNLAIGISCCLLAREILLREEGGSMAGFAGFLWFTEKISKWMNVIAYMALTFIMLLTVTDVVLRQFRHPIIGTFEIVQLAGAVVIAFGLPITSWMRGHIYVDFFINTFPGRAKNFMNILTRVIGIAIFIFIAYNLFRFATDLLISGEVTSTMQLPFYPIVYGMGVACFMQCLVLIADIVKVMGGKYE